MNWFLTLYAAMGLTIQPLMNESPQLNLNELDQQSARFLEAVHLDNVLKHEDFTKKVTIAVIDTGIDLSNTKLTQYVMVGTNVLDPTRSVQDDNGHGTGIAGIVAAYNRILELNHVQTLTIMPVKALTSHATGSEVSLSSAIYYAVDHDADVINISSGVHQDAEVLRKAVEYAEIHNVLITAAAGNDGYAVTYPAAYPTVLAVGGIDENKKVIQGSNRGNEIDIVAPWYANVLTLDGKSRIAEGTSLSTAHLSSVSAMARSKFPNLTAAEIRNKIRQSTEDIDIPGWDENTGYGLLRADKLLSTPYESETTQEILPIPIGKSIVAKNDVKRTNLYSFLLKNTRRMRIICAPESNDEDQILIMKAYNDHLFFLSDQNQISTVFEPGEYSLEISSESYKEFKYTILLQQYYVPDALEKNDLPENAMSMNVDQEYKGNFDSPEDEDWFSFEKVPYIGFDVIVKSLTPRLDVALEIYRKNEPVKTVDNDGVNGNEYYVLPGEESGNFYFKLTDVYHSPYGGEYSIKIISREKK